MMKIFGVINPINYLTGVSRIICLLFLSTSQASQVNLSVITEFLDNIQSTHTVAATSVLVVSQNEVLVNIHSGLKDWEIKQPFTDKDMYRIGSISKSFAGVLALRLQQKGMINLNDSIAAYGLLPYLNNTFSGRTITLAQLLEHTAGLADLTKAEWDYNESEPISLEQGFKLKLGDHKTRWPPGVHRSYSNVGPGLFGLALELKLGKTYETLMQKHVFDPLNMHSSSLLFSPKVQQSLITGYDRDGRKPIKYWHNIYRPFAAINTNNQDMIQWLQMLLKQDKNFLSQDDWQRLVMPTSTLAAQSGLSFGYGLGIYQWQTDARSFYGHGGDADGYLSRFGYNPESGLAYFVMINAFNQQPLNQIVGMLEQQITADSPKPKYPTRIKLSSDELAELVGSYQQVTARFGGVSNRPKEPSLKFYTANYKLYYRHKNGPETAIYKVTKNQFRTANNSVATMAFIEDQGKLYLQGPLGNFVKVNSDQHQPKSTEN